MYLKQKHSIWTRIYHWLNAPILLIMIWSGIMIYWAQDVGGVDYDIRIGDRVIIEFFPTWFYELPGKIWDGADLDHKLFIGMAWHFTFMWLFAINGVLYVGYTLYSGAWRELVPTWRSPWEAFQVVLHDLGIRKEPLPPGKFNHAQRIAYTGVIVMGFGSLVTGLAIYKPEQLAVLTNVLGGYQTARWLHFALTVGYVLFFIIHIGQVIRAGWNNFRSMVIGVELVREPAPIESAKPITTVKTEAHA